MIGPKILLIGLIFYGFSVYTANAQIKERQVKIPFCPPNSPESCAGSAYFNLERGYTYRIRLEVVGDLSLLGGVVNNVVSIGMCIKVKGGGCNWIAGLKAIDRTINLGGGEGTIERITVKYSTLGLAGADGVIKVWKEE